MEPLKLIISDGVRPAPSACPKSAACLQSLLKFSPGVDRAKRFAEIFDHATIAGLTITGSNPNRDLNADLKRTD